MTNRSTDTMPPRDVDGEVVENCKWCRSDALALARQKGTINALEFIVKTLKEQLLREQQRTRKARARLKSRPKVSVEERLALCEAALRAIYFVAGDKSHWVVDDEKITRALMALNEGR